MARKRMIDPGIWESEDFSKLSRFARLVWIGLFSNADDAGRGKANPAYIKSLIFAYDEDVDIQDIKNALDEIEKSMSISFYEVDGKRYFQLKSWQKFQTINRPSPSQIPTKNEEEKSNQTQFSEHSVNSQEQINDNSLPKKEIEKEIEVKEEVEVKENTLTSAKESGTPLSQGDKEHKHKYGTYKNVLLTEDEYNRLVAENINGVTGLEAIEYLSYHREMKGYKCKSDNLAIRKWCFNAVREDQQREAKLNKQQTSNSDNRRESPLEQMSRVFGGS